MTLLQVRGVTRRFGGLTAVDQVSFDVHEGTVQALIGPNGAGKSTLFNCLTGFDTPDAGSIAFSGADITGAKPGANVARGIARTFQNTQLFDEMSALENVLVGAQARRGSGFLSATLRLPAAIRQDREDAEEAGRLLRLLGLEAGRPRGRPTFPQACVASLKSHGRLLLGHGYCSWTNPLRASTRPRPPSLPRPWVGCAIWARRCWWSSTIWGS